MLVASNHRVKAPGLPLPWLDYRNKFLDWMKELDQ